MREYLPTWQGHLSHWIAAAGDIPIYVFRYEDMLLRAEEVLRCENISIKVVVGVDYWCCCWWWWLWWGGCGVLRGVVGVGVGSGGGVVLASLFSISTLFFVGGGGSAGGGDGGGGWWWRR